MEVGGGLGEGGEEEQAEQGRAGGEEGAGRWRQAGGGLQGPGSQIDLHDSVFNVRAARNSCRRLPSVTAQLYDKSFPSYLESRVFCCMVNGPLTHPLKSLLRRPYKPLSPMCGVFLLPVATLSAVTWVSGPAALSSPSLLHSLPEAATLLTCPSPDTKEKMLT